MTKKVKLLKLAEFMEELGLSIEYSVYSESGVDIDFTFPENHYAQIISDSYSGLIDKDTIRQFAEVLDDE